MSATSARDALPEFIATERLTLRAPALADLEQLVALANDPLIYATTAVMPYPYTDADGHQFITQTAPGAGARAYAIINADDRFIGVVSFKFENGKAPELGYWIGQPFWGRGYAQEASRGLLDDAGLTGLFPRVNARALASNVASLRVLEKSGFTLVEKTVSTTERHKGQPVHLFTWESQR